MKTTYKKQYRFNWTDLITLNEKTSELDKDYIEDVLHSEQRCIVNNDYYLKNSYHKYKKFVLLPLIKRTTMFKRAKWFLEIYNIDTHNKLNKCIYSDYIQNNIKSMEYETSEFITMLLIAFYENKYPELHNKLSDVSDKNPTYYTMKHNKFEYLFRYWFFSCYKNTENENYIAFVNHITGEQIQIYLQEKLEVIA